MDCIQGQEWLMMHLPNFGAPTEMSYVDVDNVPDDDEFVHAEEPNREDVEVLHHNEVLVDREGRGVTRAQVHRGPTFSDFLGLG